MRTASAPEEANLTCPLVKSVQSAQDEATHANSRQYQDPLNTGMGPSIDQISGAIKRLRGISRP